MYQCGNCGRQIGALEQPYQWGAHVVCPECAARFARNAPAAPPASPLEQIASAQRAGPLPYRRGGQYHDQLWLPRLLMLIVAVVLMALGGATSLIGLVVFAGWLGLGIYHLISKSRSR